MLHVAKTNPFLSQTKCESGFLQHQGNPHSTSNFVHGWRNQDLEFTFWLESKEYCKEMNA
jgi:hypothetical protein